MTSNPSRSGGGLVGSSSSSGSSGLAGSGSTPGAGGAASGASGAEYGAYRQHRYSHQSQYSSSGGNGGGSSSASTQGGRMPYSAAAYQYAYPQGYGSSSSSGGYHHHHLHHHHHSSSSPPIFTCGTSVWKLCLSVLLTTVAVEIVFVLFTGLHLYHGVMYQTDDGGPLPGLGGGWDPETNTTLYPPGPIHINPFRTTTLAPEAEKSVEQFLKEWKAFCQKKVVAIPPGSEGSPLCPCIPRHLIGNIKVKMSAPTFGEMELAHPELEAGGRFRPRDCIARHRVAIIIPFRDREEHLRIFLSHMHPYLQRQELDYRIFIVEQAAPDIFNKAMMMNVGFREARKMDVFDCFIFHDVDMIPEDDRNFYTCSEMPRHVGSHCDKFNYRVPYAGIFGGAVSMTRGQFEHVNGFSNQFYGWGGEDDDMYRRVVSRKFKVERFPGKVARYTMIKHGRDHGNPYNKHSGIAWKWRPKHYLQDGLNTLRYKTKALEHRPLYTWVYVEIPSAPAYFYKGGYKASKAGGSSKDKKHRAVVLKAMTSPERYVRYPMTSRKWKTTTATAAVL